MKLSTLKKRLKGFARIENMQSPNGNDVPNQLIHHYDNATVFQSYDSVIAIKYKGKIYLTDAWDYSRTTGKYRNYFLGEGISETRKNIKNGTYKILK